MIAYGKFGNLKQRDRIIGLHQWKGDEMVLDVGTGLGLLLAGVATKLTAGKACGIDVFNRYDLSGNTLSGLQENLRTENVTERTVIVKQSILETSFNDQTFDVVVSNLCLHNIYDAVSRKKACGEIYRVMKPGAAAIISDFTHIREYEKNFAALGMTVHRAGVYLWDTFPPLSIIVARKAG
jgi:ubiquinone/menaquinone biosynthesis C-methylase UbiE